MGLLESHRLRRIDLSSQTLTVLNANLAGALPRVPVDFLSNIWWRNLLPGQTNGQSNPSPLVQPWRSRISKREKNMTSELSLSIKWENQKLCSLQSQSPPKAHTP